MSEMAEGQAAPSEASSFPFQAEVSQVLDIVIHSLYSNREIFLRELISNAADALDKLRFASISDPELHGGDSDYRIRISADKEGKRLTIADNGIGMGREELINDLGTIARSGSKRFVEAMQQKGQGGESADLIGQFGVGFYSAFLVADRVDVTSRAAGSDEAWRWSSDAKSSFDIETADRAERGTEIVLHLGDEHEEFLDDFRLRNLIKRYSDYISSPIELLVEKREGEGDDEVVSREFEAVNEGGALWKRPRNEITDEQYEEFYKHLTHDWEAPLARTHFTIEGMQLFTGLFFIPKNPPFDLFDRDKRRGVRLYVKRVFIMDDCEELLPEWLRFLRGVVDSDDLPLNVSRELLQEDRSVKAIRKQVVRKSIDLLEELAEKKADDYKTFWGHYGVVLKEGLHFETDHRDRLAKLARFTSSLSEFCSLDEYVERMPEAQKAIYYVLGASKEAVANGPHMEALQKKGYEVLYLTDPIDEWAVSSLPEFDGKPLVSAMKADLDLESELSDDEKKEKEEQKEKLEALIDRIGGVLESDVSEVRVSDRLTDSPCCLVVPEGGMHAHIERLLRAQGREGPASKRILEINAGHPVIERLRLLEESKPASEEVSEWVRLLHEQALVAEGSPLGDPQGFARRISKLMEGSMGAGS